MPANEAVTMSMAAAAGIDVPTHGLVPAIDGGWVYLVRRFDRTGRSGKLHVEDFAQLSGATRETKYESSFLSAPKKAAYLGLLGERVSRLGLPEATPIGG